MNFVQEFLQTQSGDLTLTELGGVLSGDGWMLELDQIHDEIMVKQEGPVPAEVLVNLSNAIDGVMDHMLSQAKAHFEMVKSYGAR